MVDDKSKRKLDGKRLSKQPYERQYLAGKCRSFLKEKGMIVISDYLTLNSVRKLVRFYLRNYKKV